MFLAGLTMLCFSAPIAFYCYVYGSTDESTGIIFMIACLVALAGAVMMVFGRMKQKNSAALKSIENNTKADFCPKCNVNVSSQNGHCPLCRNELEKR